MPRMPKVEKSEDKSHKEYWSNGVVEYWYENSEAFFPYLNPLHPQAIQHSSTPTIHLQINLCALCGFICPPLFS